MIYLIKTEYKEITLLKIGYTGDDNKESRYSQYKLHNPCCKVIFEVPEGTEELERALHIYFKDHSYSDYGREWFKYSNEIYDFFVNNKTADDISSKLFHLIPSIHSKPISKKVCCRILDKCLNIKLSKTTYNISEATVDREVLIEKIMELKLSSIPAIENNALLLTGVARSDFENYGDDLPENLVEFIENFNTLSGFYEKMKAICEAPFTDKEILMVLEQVPLTYKNHYLKAGPERLKANGYNLTKINKELAAIEQNGQINISSEIFSAFKIGETYKLQEIKEILKTVYESCNYLVSPKATDLENYFEIRKVQMTNKETGKRDHCLKLIGKKEL